MKGRLPHIILRFSKQVAPPNPPSAQPTNEEDITTDFLGPKASTNRIRDSLSMSSDSETSLDIAKTTKKRVKKQQRHKNTQKHSLIDANNTNHLRTSAVKSRLNGNDSIRDESFDRPSPATFLGKRKRRIPKSIGGGKGDLKPPSNIHQGVSNTPQVAAIINDSAQSTEATNKEEKRVLRSQAAPKEGRYEWFFQKEEEVDYDKQMTIVNLPQEELKKLTPYFKLKSNDEDEEELAKKKMVDQIRKIPVQKVDLEAELRKISNDPPQEFTKDPLSDEIYKAPHLAQGKLERRVRNVEREKLAHNAYQLKQDIEQAHSADWIKLLGISTATQGSMSKGELEQKRIEFIEYCSSLIEKHRQWEEAERKKKQKAGASPKDSLDRDTAEAEDYQSKLSHSADEAIASKQNGRQLKKRDRSEFEPEPEFVSFYDSLSARIQALNTEGRKSSRNQTAFGQPLPVFTNKEYELSEEIIASSRAVKGGRARRRLSRD